MVPIAGRLLLKTAPEDLVKLTELVLALGPAVHPLWCTGLEDFRTIAVSEASPRVLELHAPGYPHPHRYG